MRGASNSCVMMAVGHQVRPADCSCRHIYQPSMAHCVRGCRGRANSVRSRYCVIHCLSGVNAGLERCGFATEVAGRTCDNSSQPSDAGLATSTNFSLRPWMRSLLGQPHLLLQYGHAVS